MTDHDDTTHLLSRRAALRLGLAGGIAGLAMPNLLGKPAFAQGAAAKEAAKKAPAGRVIVGLTQEPTVLNPLMLKIEVDDGVHFSLFDALFRIAPDGVIAPNLAAEVPTQANGGISQDGLNWRVRLRDGVRWHDGKPFTAEDVKFTLELITNPKFRAWRTAGHSLVRDITVVSPTEITWRMEKPFAPYLSFLTETFIVPKHVLETAADPNAADFNKAPIGTGAFKWGKRTAGDNVELVANRDYHGEGPYIETLVYKYIPDLTVFYTQFKSGDIDLTGQTYITPDNYKEAKTLPNKVVALVPRQTIEGIHFNLEKPQFKELAVRQALYAAIDKGAIIEALYYGVPSAAESYMPRSSFYFNDKLPKQTFDVKAARKLLDEAGWKPGRDGIRAKDGVRLSFNNTTTSGDHLREQVQQFLKQSWADIGVEMNIANMPAAVLWGDVWAKSQFDTVISGVVFMVASDPDVTNRFHSKSIGAKGGRGSNTTQYSNPEVDALLDKGTGIFDPEERRKVYNRVQEIVRNDLPFMPIFQYTAVLGHKKSVQGYVHNANTRTESWNVAGWSRAG
jgi:peptide/nickel transport system substrate-binding protein